MIEIRLCSIEGGEWLDSIERTPNTPVRKTPKSFGTMIDRAMTQRLTTVSNAGELSASGATGIVLAPTGIQFDEELLVSAVHAVACAALVSKTGAAEYADALAALIRGENSISRIPASLKRAGVISCLSGDMAQKFGGWLGQVDQEILTQEIRDLHGEDAVKTYLGAIGDLRGIFTRGTQIHGCDVCCWRGNASAGG